MFLLSFAFLIVITSCLGYQIGDLAQVVQRGPIQDQSGLANSSRHPGMGLSSVKISKSSQLTSLQLTLDA